MWLQHVRCTTFIDDEKPRSYNVVISNLYDWQSLNITSGPHTQFYNFCDALEVKDGVQAPASGWGGEHAINAWGSYWRDFYFEQRKLFYSNIKECQHIDRSNITVCGNIGAEFVYYVTTPLASF